MGRGMGIEHERVYVSARVRAGEPTRNWRVTAEVYHAPQDAPEDEYAYSMAFQTVIQFPADEDLKERDDDALVRAVRSRVCEAVWDEQRHRGLGVTHIGTIQNVQVELAENVEPAPLVR